MVGLEALFVEVRHESHYGGVQPLWNHHHHCERACHGDSAGEVSFQAKAGGVVQWASGIRTLLSNNHQCNLPHSEAEALFGSARTSFPSFFCSAFSFFSYSSIGLVYCWGIPQLSKRVETEMTT